MKSPDLDVTSARIDYVDVQQRIRAVSLLFCGAASGLCAFLFAGFLGLWKYKEGQLQTNFRGEPFASGMNYYPQTVSEMVSDPASPSGKCFFAFSMIGSICVLMSWYPWQLHNVYVGCESRVCCLLPISSPYLRQFCPPIGMMLVACLRVVPHAQATFRDWVTINLHNCGAVMMIGGYGLVEVHCLLSKKVKMLDRERRVRWTLVVISLLCAAGFQVCGGAAIMMPKFGICCTDEWRIPTMDDIAAAKSNMHPGSALEAMQAFEHQTPMLYNTAYGPALWIKQAEYWLEVLAGLFMVASHLTIWWFCPERQLELDEHLDDPSTHLKDVETELDKSRGYGGTPRFSPGR